MGREGAQSRYADRVHVYRTETPDDIFSIIFRSILRNANGKHRRCFITRNRKEVGPDGPCAVCVKSIVAARTNSKRIDPNNPPDRITRRSGIITLYTPARLYVI